MARVLDIQGHRGARALFPENTLEGFRAAAELDVTAFELDVGMTADGLVVVIHDFALNPDIARDARGAWLAAPGPTVWLMSYADLSRYDVGRLRPVSPTAALFPDQQHLHDGARVPTLAAVLAALPPARFTIEGEDRSRAPRPFGFRAGPRRTRHWLSSMRPVPQIASRSRRSTGRAVQAPTSSGRAQTSGWPG